MIEVKDNLLQQYEQTWREHFAGEDKDWLYVLRQQQLNAFLVKGFPTTKDEHWKYTNVAPIKKQLFEFSKPIPSPVEQNKISQFFLTGDYYRLVFVDGFFDKNNSILPIAGKYIIANLAEALKQHADLVQHYFNQQKNLSAFGHLNLACVKDGVFIYAPKYCSIKKPIQIIFLTTGSGSCSWQNTHNIIIAESQADLTLIEEHQSLTDRVYVSNVFTQIDAGEASRVEYIKLQNQHHHSFHLGNIDIRQKKDSQVFAHHYSLGAQLARDDLHCYLNETNAFLRLQGLYLPLNYQHIDLHSFIYHCADHTTSEELFKGVIASKSRAVFNGKICVEKNIKHNFANLQNKNLLLARDAEVNTKPELEIYSDNVKCQHGATVGQIDKEMLFYLRSRGISEEEAYQVLLMAFIQEPLKDMSEEVAQKILRCITKHCEVVQ